MFKHEQNTEMETGNMQLKKNFFNFHISKKLSHERTMTALISLSFM